MGLRYLAMLWVISVHLFVSNYVLICNFISIFLGDMIIHTTAEIVIGNCIGFKFQRCFDESTGFDELEITDKPECETT